MRQAGSVLFAMAFWEACHTLVRLVWRCVNSDTNVAAHGQMKILRFHQDGTHPNVVERNLVYPLPKKRSFSHAQSHHKVDPIREVLEYIEMFHNAKRAHTNIGMLSPIDLEIRQQNLNQAGVWETRDTSSNISHRQRCGGQTCPYLS